MIVMSKPYSLILDYNLHGVHKIWNKQKVNFKTGMRLAVCSVVQLRSSILNMLYFQENKDLGNGQFQVELEEQENFRFRVELASDLHKFLQFKSGSPIRSNIITHVVSVCFSRLKSDYSDDDENSGWCSFRGLRALSDFLESNNITNWSDKDFCPELAATKLYPHKIVDGEIEE